MREQRQLPHPRAELGLKQRKNQITAFRKGIAHAAQHAIKDEHVSVYVTPLAFAAPLAVRTMKEIEYEAGPQSPQRLLHLCPNFDCVFGTAKRDVLPASKQIGV
jgi:hypothetical protein